MADVGLLTVESLFLPSPMTQRRLCKKTPQKRELDKTPFDKNVVWRQQVDVARTVVGRIVGRPFKVVLKFEMSVFSKAKASI